jgi:hypothetical protein
MVRRVLVGLQLVRHLAMANEFAIPPEVLAIVLLGFLDSQPASSDDDLTSNWLRSAL